MSSAERQRIIEYNNTAVVEIRRHVRVCSMIIDRRRRRESRVVHIDLPYRFVIPPEYTVARVYHNPNPTGGGRKGLVIIVVLHGAVPTRLTYFIVHVVRK